MLNRIILAGNLGRNPSLEVSQKGKQLARFSLATSTTWRDEAREWHKRTEWHHVVVYREETARWIADTFKKGDPLYVEGVINYRQWQDRYGTYHKDTHIVVSGHNGHVHSLRSKDPKAESVALLERSCTRKRVETDILESEPFEEKDLFPEDFSHEDLDSKGSLFDDLQSHQSFQQQTGEKIS